MSETVKELPLDLPPSVILNRRKQHLLSLKGGSPEIRQFLDCYRELPKKAQLELAAVIEMMGVGTASGAGLLVKLIQKGYL